MCRLFGMSGGREPVTATFWLLQAPDSLAEQSRREPDGTGIGTFDADGHPIVDKRPIAAFRDEDFARAARELRSRTFVAHVRYASTGQLIPENTHPFRQDNRLFAGTHDLFVLERDAGGQDGASGLDHASGQRIRVRSGALSTRPSVVVATERMDDDPGWRPLAPGELLHVAGDLSVTSHHILDGPPAHLLTLADLTDRAAASQGAPAA